MPTTPTAAPPRGAPVWAGMLVLYLVWGSTYLAISIAVETLPPFLMAAVRFSLAGLILLAWSIAREGRAFVVPSRREWRDSAIVGALLLGGGMGMVAFGEQTIPSGITALLIATMPVWVAIFGRIFLGERLPRIAIFSIALGFAGVAILVGPSAFGGAGALDPLGPGGRPHLAHRLVDRLTVRVAPGDAAAAGRSSRPGSRWSWAASSWP